MYMNYIKGTYKKTIFSSDSGYYIGIVKIEETTEEELKDYIHQTITITGYFASLKEKEDYIFYGDVVVHPKYGLQYNVVESNKIMPSSKDGLIEFFSSELFKGIGKKLATNIVDTLGENAIDKIISDKQILYMVPKMSIKNIDKIYNTLIEHESSNMIITYLINLGFTNKISLEIYNKYRQNTIIQIENNIYELININDITFPMIDLIALNMGLKEDDPNRVKASIMYVLKNLVYTRGDTYIYKDELVSSTLNYLKLDLGLNTINEYISSLIFELKIVQEEDKYYLKDVYDDEMLIVKKLKYLNNFPKTTHSKIDKYIKELEISYGIKYNDLQIKSIKEALENNVTIITGGPGTGKTTIIKAIVDIYTKINCYKKEEAKDFITLLAPTGRASKRMSEATLFKASTIHRFLKWNKETNEFMINENNKDFSKFIIIDEVSMIDIHLLASLFRGLTDNIQLVFVGDYNQLPSVGPGQILKDFIESKLIPTIKLDVLYRQNELSYIPVLASKIEKNQIDETLFDQASDYIFMDLESDLILPNLEKLCNKLIEKKYDYKKIQIMAPMYAGINGIDNLNKRLQNIFNPKDKLKKELVLGDIVYRENDKILQLTNMPDENVFNGDIGVIRYIIPESSSDSKKNEIYVDYDGMIVKYLPKDFSKIKHGYAISIHKSQGSEFEYVILPICSKYNRMLYKKLLYTGITRAKKKLIIIGEKKAFIYGITKGNEYKRKTNLKNKLIDV